MYAVVYSFHCCICDIVIYDYTVIYLSSLLGEQAFKSCSEQYCFCGRLYEISALLDNMKLVSKELSMQLYQLVYCF